MFYISSWSLSFFSHVCHVICPLKSCFGGKGSASFHALLSHIMVLISVMCVYTALSAWPLPSKANLCDCRHINKWSFGAYNCFEHLCVPITQHPTVMYCGQCRRSLISFSVVGSWTISKDKLFRRDHLGSQNHPGSPKGLWFTTKNYGQGASDEREKRCVSWDGDLVNSRQRCLGLLGDGG